MSQPPFIQRSLTAPETPAPANPLETPPHPHPSNAASHATLHTPCSLLYSSTDDILWTQHTEHHEKRPEEHIADASKQLWTRKITFPLRFFPKPKSDHLSLIIQITYLETGREALT